MQDDRYRFTGSIRQAVYEVMKDGVSRTVQTIATLVGASETSTQSSLRDLRKYKFGSHTVLCSYNKLINNYMYTIPRA